MKAKVYVTLKKSVLDPQGKAVEQALSALGFLEAKNVRVGKYIEITVDEPSREKADARVQEMCRTLLANPVIELFRYELEETRDGVQKASPKAAARGRKRTATAR